MCGCVELGMLAGRILKNNIYCSMGLQRLAENILNIKMKKDKKIQISNWENYPLFKTQSCGHPVNGL